MTHFSSLFLALTDRRRAAPARPLSRWALTLLLLALPLLAPLGTLAQAPTVSSFTPGSGLAGTPPPRARFRATVGCPLTGTAR